MHTVAVVWSCIGWKVIALDLIGLLNMALHGSIVAFDGYDVVAMYDQELYVVRGFLLSASFFSIPVVKKRKFTCIYPIFYIVHENLFRK